ncbi:MAG: PhzF family phenazine biosynthesis protein [Acidobacteriota bacterium]
MEIRLFQVDAFASRPFEGNPAGVCLLPEPAPEAWMQRLAVEMSLSETAFVVPRGEAFDLRWFTPATEVALCGHATLASGHVLFEAGILGPDQTARFQTLSGGLEVRREGERLAMDLPSLPARASRPSAGDLAALGVDPGEVRFAGRNDLSDDDWYVLLELGTPADVAAVAPDFAALARSEAPGWIVTAAAGGAGQVGGVELDFVSRFFAPIFDVDEDPVTGSAHSTLVPFWAERLGKAEVVGRQISTRGGTVHGRLAGERVVLSGPAVTVFEATLAAPALPRPPAD